MRYLIYIAYVGKAYSGWQIQSNAVAVQQVVEKALSKVLSISTTISGSSRTDKGVHAKQQVAHFDLKKPINSIDIIYRLNRVLPTDISITAIHPVVDGAHARFDACYRTYHYTIVTEKTPFYRDSAVWLCRIPPLGLLNQIARLFCLKTDFELFSKKSDSINTSLLQPSAGDPLLGATQSSTAEYSAVCEKRKQAPTPKWPLEMAFHKRSTNFVCDVREATWLQIDQKVIFQIKANRFLRGMVRAIVGAILKVATGKMELTELTQLIREKPPIRPILTLMPPHGLTLMEVGYPETLFIA